MADLLLKKESPLAKIRLERGGSVFFYASLALFFLVLAGYGGLSLLNRSQNAAKDLLLEEVGAKRENLRPELLSQIFLLDRRLKNIRAVLSNHVFTSNALRFLESSAHPQVRFLSFTLSAAGRKIDLTGQAASYATLAKQIGILERDPGLERVEFGGLSTLDNNTVGFKLTLIFKQALLQIRP